MLDVQPSKQRKKEMPTPFLLLIPVLIWSTVFPFSKMLMPYLPPTTLAAFRFLVGAACLVAYAAWSFSWREIVASCKRRWPTYLLLGFVGIFLNNLLQNLGLNLSTASSTSLLSTTDPIFSVLLSAVFLGEALNRRKVISLGVSFAGVYLVSTNGAWINDWGTGGGNLLVIGAALSYSIYTILSKKILHEEEPPVVVACSTMVGAICLAIAAALIDPEPLWAELTSTHWWILGYLSVVPTSVSVVAYFYLLQRLQASQAALSLFLIPVISILWSVWLLGEELTWAMLVGGGLIIGGVTLAIGAERKQAIQAPDTKTVTKACS